MEIGPAARATVPALVKLLNSKEAIDDEYVPWCSITFRRRVNVAVEALAVMGPSAAPAVPALIEMLQTTEDEERADILVCLSRIGPAARKAAMPARQLLKRQADHPPKRLLGWPPPLDIPLAAACTLLRILPADDQALAIIRNSLRAPDKDLRILALESCTRTGLKEKTLVPDIIRALKDEDLQLQEAAANALAEVGPDGKAAIPDERALQPHGEP
jgi:HEAT repeat protein